MTRQSKDSWPHLLLFFPYHLSLFWLYDQIHTFMLKAEVTNMVPARTDVETLKSTPQSECPFLIELLSGRAFWPNSPIPKSTCFLSAFVRDLISLPPSELQIKSDFTVAQLFLLWGHPPGSSAPHTFVFYHVKRSPHSAHAICTHLIPSTLSGTHWENYLQKFMTLSLCGVGLQIQVKYLMHINPYVVPSYRDREYDDI